MDKNTNVLLFLLRISMGVLFFYAGITKVMNPDWTALSYIEGAHTFSGLYAWLALPSVIPVGDFLNMWGLTLIGVSLILGLFVRWGAVLGAVIMILYYFPVLDFPYPNAHSFIVDDHIIYAIALLLLSVTKSGRIWGLDKNYSFLPIYTKFPKLRKWLG